MYGGIHPRDINCSLISNPITERAKNTIQWLGTGANTSYFFNKGWSFWLRISCDYS